MSTERTLLRLPALGQGSAGGLDCLGVRQKLLARKVVEFLEGISLGRTVTSETSAP